MISRVLYAKMPPHFKKPIDLAYLQNGTYYQIEAHFVMELKLRGIENDNEILDHHVSNGNARQRIQTDLSKTTCQSCKKLGHLIKDSARESGEKRNKTRNLPKLHTAPQLQCMLFVLNIKDKKPLLINVGTVQIPKTKLKTHTTCIQC